MSIDDVRQAIQSAAVAGFDAGYGEAIATIRKWIASERGHVTVADIEALLAALAEADSAAPGKPVMSVAMSDADEGPA